MPIEIEYQIRISKFVFAIFNEMRLMNTSAKRLQSVVLILEYGIYLLLFIVIVHRLTVQFVVFIGIPE